MTDAGLALAGRVAVITGGNRGIGRGIALAMAEAVAAIAISSRDNESLEAVAQEVRAVGAECLATGCDVADESSMAAMGAAVMEHFGRVDVVVANAGVAGPTRPMQELSLVEWRDCLAIDLDGVFLTFRCFIPAMIEVGTGSLIAISSITGKRALAGRASYAAAKMAVIGTRRIRSGSPSGPSTAIRRSRMRAGPPRPGFAPPPPPAGRPGCRRPGSGAVGACGTGRRRRRGSDPRSGVPLT